MTFYALAPRIENERERLQVLARSGVAGKRPDALSDSVRLVAQLFDADMGIASVITGRRMVVVAGYGVLAGDAIERDISFCSHVVARPEAFTCVLDAAQDWRFAGNPLVTGAPHVRFYVGAPLITPCGTALGVLCAADSKSRALVTTEQQEALKALAARVALDLLAG